jgi:hypothetical protein
VAGRKTTSTKSLSPRPAYCFIFYLLYRPDKTALIC